MFAINTRWFFEYADELEQRGVRIPFECISRADRLNAEVIAAAGGDGLFPAVERLGKRQPARAGRDGAQGESRGCAAQDASCCKRPGIETGMFIMLGYEGETVEDLEATVEHLKIANPDVFLTTVAYPIKGTPYYRRGRKPHPGRQSLGRSAATAI